MQGKVTGCVLDLPMQEGSGTTVYDKSRFGNNGTITAGAGGWVQLPSGVWTYQFDGSATKISLGNLGQPCRALSLWVKLNDTTEVIFEELAANGVSATAGTLSYSNWDNAFVNGADTDTITATWSHLVVTSTTDVTMSAMTLGLVDATYLTGFMTMLKGFNRALTPAEIRAIYERERRLFQ